MKILKLMLALMLGVMWCAHVAFANKIVLGSQVIGHDYLQAILAKELCSCTYVTRPGPDQATDQDRLKMCFERSNLPMSPGLLRALVGTETRIDDKSNMHEVTSSPEFLGDVLSLFRGRQAVAVYEGDGGGCRLIPRN